MKKTFAGISLLMVFVLTVCLCGCGTGTVKDGTTAGNVGTTADGAVTEAGENKAAYAESLAEKCSGKTYNELVKKQYGTQLISYFKGLGGYAFKSLSTYVSFNAINEKYPVECLRKAENGRMYAIYKTDKGLFYVFFVSVGSADASDYAFTYGTLMSRKLSSADFDSVSVGDSIEAAEKIEPAIKCIRDYYESAVPETEDNGLLYFTVLLSDGELVLTVDRKDNTITKKENFDKCSFNHNGIFEIDPICNIAPNDLP